MTEEVGEGMTEHYNPAVELTLRVTEIFRSIQGEGMRAGFPCAFIRLTGCSLRCVWCDSAYAFHGGQEMSVSDAVEKVLALGTELVEITGGEPLEQEGVYPLMERLLEAGKTVLLETGGHVPLDRVDSRVCLLYTSDAADDLLCVDLGCR